MRVTFISPYTSERDGIAEYSRVQVAELRTRGHQVHVVEPRPVETIDEKVIGALGRLAWGDGFRDLIATIMRQSDVVHVQMESSIYKMRAPYLLSLIRALRINRISVVVTMHGPTPQFGLMDRYIYATIVNAADQILVSTDQWLKAVVALVPGCQVKTLLAFNASQTPTQPYSLRPPTAVIDGSTLEHAYQLAGRSRTTEWRPNKSDKKPFLSVVICSLNGAERIGRCLTALLQQVTEEPIEIIVVDDGSTDSTTDTARAFGVRVIRHHENQGVSSARNAGIKAAEAEFIAFLDDDCEPEVGWAGALVDAWNDSSRAVVGLGGPVLPIGRNSLLTSYLLRNNPLRPLEISLAQSSGFGYRLWLYMRSRYAAGGDVVRGESQELFAVAGANMSFRRSVLVSLGGFDERLRFGAEETELCIRARSAGGRLQYVDSARVRHHFKSHLSDQLRRYAAYGAGSASLSRVQPLVRPTVLPIPVITIVAICAGLRFRPILVVAIMLPLLTTDALSEALKRHDTAILLDPYFRAAEDTAHLGGLIRALIARRGLVASANPPLEPTK